MLHLIQDWFSPIFNTISIDCLSFSLRIKAIQYNCKIQIVKIIINVVTHMVFTLRNKSNFIWINYFNNNKQSEFNRALELNPSQNFWVWQTRKCYTECPPFFNLPRRVKTVLEFYTATYPRCNLHSFWVAGRIHVKIRSWK